MSLISAVRDLKDFGFVCEGFPGCDSLWGEFAALIVERM